MQPKTLAVFAAVTLSASLAGCALFDGKPDPSPELAFSYAATNGPATGLVRAFVLNGSTVLQFVDISQAQPKVYAAEQATPMPYQVIGQYAVLSGIHAALRVTANGATATVTATSTPTPKAPTAPLFPGDPRPIGTNAPATAAAVAAPAAPAAPAPAAVAPKVTADDLLLHEQHELTQLRKEVEDLKRDLAGQVGAGASIPAGAIVPAGSSIKAAALIVPTGDAARAWSLAGNRTLRDNLAELAQQAGYTVTWKASNPYMVTYTKRYQGTFQEVVGEIAQEAPALDFRLYAWKHRLDVVDAMN